MNRVNPQEVAGEVMMLRTRWKGPVMLVEGPGDVQFFEAIYDSAIMRVIPASGWENVLEAKRLLDDQKISNIMCVIDLDYKGVLKKLPTDPDTFTTDFRDLEIMMIESPALQKVIKENGSKKKIGKWHDSVQGIKNHAYGLASGIGALRFHSEAEDLGLCFKELQFKKFVDRTDMSFSASAFINHLRGKWPLNKKVTVQMLNEAIARCSNYVELTDHTYLCCGHDVAEILAIGLRSAWGTNGSRAFTGPQIEGLLRLAYSKEDFFSTVLAQKITEWFERKNEEEKVRRCS